MYVVAVAAAHIAKAQRMTGSLVDVRTLALVAIEANLLLLERIEHRITIRVDVVTGNTSDVGVFMRTAEPALAFMADVTAQAHLVLLARGNIGVITEYHLGWHFGFLFRLDGDAPA